MGESSGVVLHLISKLSHFICGYFKTVFYLSP